MSDQVSAARFFSVINASSCGAKADGVADDTPALQLAIDSALALRVSVRLGPGTYRIVKYLDVNGARSLHIIGDGATIRYPSDEQNLVPDTIATSPTMVRSAILLRHCTDVSIQGITFVGGSTQNLSVNQGGAIYATHCVGTRVNNCTMIEGNSPFQQDVQTDTHGIGDSFTIEPGVYTLKGLGEHFVSGHVGQLITIAGCTQPTNDGSFRIASVIDGTKLTYANPNGVAETSSFRWSIADADRDTRIEACRFETRGVMTIGSDSAIERCHFERPMGGSDATGIGDVFTFAPASGKITLTDSSGPFLPHHHGKYITIAGATSSANAGTHQLTYIGATQVSWINPAGSAELFQGTWWIMGGDITGLGAGASGLVRSGTTVTLTSATAAFSPSDAGKMIRIKGATTAAHNGAFVLTFVSPTQVSWTNGSPSLPTAPLVEAFLEKWAIDAYDSGKDGGDTYGSTHGIYLFGGRNNVLIQGCTFKGIRTVAIKVSGTAQPLRNITVAGNYAKECGAFFIGGADDSQEHTGLSVHGNQIVDCGTGRDGWNDGGAISVLGSRNVSIMANLVHYTHNAIGSVDGRGVGGLRAIQASRYVEGNSQPIEDVAIVGNTITADPSSTAPRAILHTAIALHSVGQLTKYGKIGTLAIDVTPLDPSINAPIGQLMLLEDPRAHFSIQDVGKTLTLVASGVSNHGPFTIETVRSITSLTYRDASQSNVAVSDGTYRLSPQSDERGSACLVADNQIVNVGTRGISSQYSVGPEIRGNIFSGLLSNIDCDGDVAPRIVGNREIGTGTQNARLALRAGVAWPFVDDNVVTNQAIGSSSSRGWGVAVAGSAAVDYPLLGKRGRVRPTDAMEQVVVGYGSLHVDGDTITVMGSTYTYAANAPVGSPDQFNSFDSLRLLTDNQTGHACADYGFRDPNSGVPSVSTGHLLIRRSEASAGPDGALHVQVSALNPTALVLLRNHGGANMQCDGRGSGSADPSGPIPDKTVVWSPACSAEGGAWLWADNVQAQTLLQASSFRPLKNAEDDGCCEVLTHGASKGDGKEEFRWALA